MPLPLLISHSFNRFLATIQLSVCGISGIPINQAFLFCLVICRHFYSLIWAVDYQQIKPAMGVHESLLSFGPTVFLSLTHPHSSSSHGYHDHVVLMTLPPFCSQQEDDLPPNSQLHFIMNFLIPDTSFPKINVSVSILSPSHSFPLISYI